jgi:hypothetical protein
MPVLRVTRHVEPSMDLQEYASFNTCYAVWLAKVDALCGRLLNVELLQLLESDGIDPWEDWNSGVRPERFFSAVLVPHIELDQGAEFIDEVIGLEAMWGASSP